MKIELRKIALHKGLSEETPAYTADVYADGVLVCHVKNEGHGGCDYQYPAKGKTRKDIDVVEAFCKALPKVSFHGRELGQSLEMICHTQVWDQDLVKTVKRDLSSKVMFTKKDGKLYQIKAKGDADKQKVIAFVKSKADTVSVLNEMSLPDAVAIYKKG